MNLVYNLQICYVLIKMCIRIKNMQMMVPKRLNGVILLTKIKGYVMFVQLLDPALILFAANAKLDI